MAHGFNTSGRSTQQLQSRTDRVSPILWQISAALAPATPSPLRPGDCRSISWPQVTTKSAFSRPTSHLLVPVQNRGYLPLPILEDRQASSDEISTVRT